MAIEMEPEGKKAMKKLARARAERARYKRNPNEEATAKPGYNPGRLIVDAKDYKGPKPWSMKKARRMNKGLNK